MSEKVKVAVIGTGALGKSHARIYSELAADSKVDFAGVFDVNAEVAQSFASKYNVQRFNSVEEAIENCDAFSVVTPTFTHFEVGSKILSLGKHALIEKPITDNPDHATELVELAQKNKCVLQVGHVERFNPVYTYLSSAATKPKFIESHRLSPFPGRSTDIGVVLDLMIHDLDIVLAFVKSPVVSMDAVGIAVLSKTEDIANVRLRFENGCVANLTSSRISPERMRKIRVFSGGEEPCYVSLDYMEQQGYLYRLGRDNEEESSLLKKLLSAKNSMIVSEFAGKKIVREPVPIKPDEPLKLELQHFIQCVDMQQTPEVSGEAGKRALDLALEITKEINQTSGKI